MRDQAMAAVRALPGVTAVDVQHDGERAFGVGARRPAGRRFPA